MKKKWMPAALACCLCLLCLAGCGVEITSASLPPEAALARGETLALPASYGTGKEASAEALEKAVGALSPVWSSSDEAVATVDADGTVHAQSAGEAVVTLAAKEGVTAACHVTVYIPLESLRAAGSIRLALHVEESAPLEAALTPADATGVVLRYESSDETVATVGADGTVHARGVGECTIKTRAASDIGAGEAEKEWETAVVVLLAPAKLSVEDMVLTVGETAAVTVDLGLDEGEAADAGTKFTFESSDEAAVAVGADGAITAAAVGEAVVSVKNELGQTCEFTVSVQDAACAYCGRTGHASASCPQRAANRAGNQAATAGGNAGGSSGASAGGTGSAAPGAEAAPAPSQPYCPFCNEYGHTCTYHGNGGDAGICPVCNRMYGSLFEEINGLTNEEIDERYPVAGD